MWGKSEGILVQNLKISKINYNQPFLNYNIGGQLVYIISIPLRSHD